MDNWNKLYVFLTIWEEIVMSELEKKKIEQDYKNSIQKYRNNPVLFCEEFLGIKLFESQKQYLEILLKIKNGENENEWNRYFKFI